MSWFQFSSLDPRKLPPSVLISIALLATCVGLRIADPEPIARLRLSVFDAYIRTAPRTADPSFPVRVVAIDESSLAKIGQWPWPRTKLAEIVRRLVAAGARSVAFDLVLAEPDRLSPNELVRSLGQDEKASELIAEVAKLPSNDERLADAIAAAPSIIGIAGDANGGRHLPPPRLSLSFAGDDPAGYAHAFPGGIGSLPRLANAAKGIGAVNWLPARDQIVRTVPLIVTVAGKLYPSLALEALRVGEKQSTIFVKASGGSGLPAFGQQTGIEFIRIGQSILPTDGAGELWLKFAAADPRRTISASRILDGTFDPNEIKSRHIIIGATAVGLLDLRATPLSTTVPGVEIHAQALEQMLAGDHLMRPAYATGAEIAFLVIAGALLAAIIARSGALNAAVIGALVICAVIALSWFAYSRGGLLFDPVYPALSLALVYLGSSLTSYIQSETQRAQIRSAFSHYVAPSLVAELEKNYESLRLGGETREVTLLFADVRGFSRLSEGLSAEGVVRFVNRLFTPLTETILEHQGTIDKFMGDAVMAFWNAPVKDAEHEKNACRAALAMLSDIDRLNGEFAAESGATDGGAKCVRLGIGLNTGPCVVGNVGSPQRFDYSVLGDVVNVAARFEEATKTFGAEIIVGERTASAAKDFALLELGTVTPRGKDRPERIFALLGDEALAQSPAFAEIRDAHRAFMIAREGGDATAFETARARCVRVAPSNFAAFYRSAAAHDNAVIQKAKA